MLSVIIPTYREPKHLDLCLQSAIEGQTQENEIIVIVDGFLDENKEVLSKYPNIKCLVLEQNRGLSFATNIGVYHSSHDTILVVNDDNVFPKNWDSIIESDLRPKSVLTPNQIEAQPSAVFRQFLVHNFGSNPECFDLDKFQSLEQSFRVDSVTREGCTLPFAMNKYDFLAVGGWDIMYPSPHVVDWDFFLKCEYWGLQMLRTYKCNFYHFYGAATRQNFQQNLESSQKEVLAHQFFINKWKEPAINNPLNNSKMLKKFQIDEKHPL
jgi:glycosyltransferase involved in cell wall biosynthesis